MSGEFASSPKRNSVRPMLEDDETRQWMTETEFISEIGSWVYDPQTDVEFWSPGLVSLLNVPTEDSNLKLFEYIPSLESEITTFISSKVPFIRRKFVYRTYTDSLILLFQSEKRFNSDGKITKILGTFQNISDIVWTFGVPGMGDQLLQAVISCEDVLVGAVNTDMVFTYIDGDGWGKLNRKPDELLGQSLHELLVPYPGVLKLFEDTLQEGPRSGYYSLADRHYTAKTRPLYGPDGDVVGVICFAIDITDRKIIIDDLERGKELLEESVRLRTEELRANEAMPQSVLATSNAGVVVTDKDNNITYANSAYRNMVGYGSGSLQGQSISLFMEPDVYNLLCKREKSINWDKETIVHFRRDIAIPKKNGESMWIDVNAALIGNAKDRFAHLVAVVIDITEQRRILDGLQEAKVASDTANSAKSQFLAHMSHEIRTPLNGVIGLSDLLMGTDLSHKQREYAGLIKVSGQSLLFLINDILDFSKIEAGKLEIEKEEFDLIMVVESVLGILATRASDKGLELCGSFASDVPQFVYGDSGRIRQVLINLVGNALKFTKKGGVKVQVSVESSVHTPNGNVKSGKQMEVVLRFSVSDTGIGISEEGLTRLFRSFSQIDNTASRKHDGSGLGLAISKQLVELMNGEMHVESAIDEGSTFWFTIPTTCQADAGSYTDDGFEEVDPATGRKEVKHGSVHLSGRLAIVVDDNEVQRSALAEQLTSWGMDVTMAAYREEAIQYLLKAVEEDNPYQLAIIDSSIADGEGMDLVDAMKSDDRLKETAIILLTPLTVDTDIAVIHSAGVSMHVSKPVFSSSLFDATITALFAKGNTGASASVSDLLNAEDAMAEGFDERRSMIRILVAEDNRINQIVVRDTLEQAGFQCKIVENGLLALQALSEELFDAVLMDCQMPEMDGLEATRRIRDKETEDLYTGKVKRRIPIIALTANATKGDEVLCMEAGMDAYCSKPINPKLVVRTIDQWIKPILSLRKKQKQGDNLPPFPVKTFFSLCGKNKMIATMVLSDFLHQVPEDLSAVCEAIEQERYENAASILQHIRGKAGLLGATVLEKQAQELEVACLTPEGQWFDKLLDLLCGEANRCLKHAVDAKSQITA